MLVVHSTKGSRQSVHCSSSPSSPPSPSQFSPASSVMHSRRRNRLPILGPQSGRPKEGTSWSKQLRDQEDHKDQRASAVGKADFFAPLHIYYLSFLTFWTTEGETRIDREDERKIRYFFRSLLLSKLFFLLPIRSRHPSAPLLLPPEGYLQLTPLPGHVHGEEVASPPGPALPLAL